MIQVVLISFIYLTSTTVYGMTYPQVNKNSLIEKLNLILSKQEDDQPGVSVLVKKDNEIIFQLNKGLADKDRILSINSSTGFRIGSISKSFTALAVIKLIEQDKLSLDDDVTKYVPELSIDWKAITIKHLLSHRVYISDDFFQTQT